MNEHMTRVEISDAMWRRFRSLAVERGIGLPELLGSVITGYVVRAEKRRLRLLVEATPARKGRQMRP